MMETNADESSPQIEVADNGSPKEETLQSHDLKPNLEIPASKNVIQTTLNEVGTRVTRRKGSLKLQDRGAKVGLKN